MKAEQNSYTLKFKDKELEREFVDFHKEHTMSYTRNAIILALVMFYLFHFIDNQIVAGLQLQNAGDRTMIENVLNENMLLNNPLTSLIKDPFENILLQQKDFTTQLENNIWKIRFNTLIVGLIVFAISFMKRFRGKLEYFAAAIGIFGGIAVSIMISYVSGTASFIYLSGLMLIMTWMAVLVRVRYTIAFVSLIIIIGFNNIITANEFIFDLLHQGQELVGGLVTKGQIKINMPVNNFFLLSTMVLVLFAAYIIEKYSRENFIKNKENEALLLNILPKEIAEIKKRDENKVISNYYDNVTILFSDIVGFTKFSSSHKPEEVVGLLNDLYSSFDDLTHKYNIEKIKTIGDGYMLASGVPAVNDNHAQNMADMAMAMFESLKEFNKKYSNNSFQIRVGISSGPVVAGVVGKRKFAYDIWGDTVNTASRMESNGEEGKIQVSEATYELLKDKYSFEEPRIIDVKGKGKLKAYFLKQEI